MGRQLNRVLGFATTRVYGHRSAIMKSIFVLQCWKSRSFFFPFFEVARRREPSVGFAGGDVNADLG